MRRLFLIIGLLLVTQTVHAQSTPVPMQEFSQGRVTRILNEKRDDVEGMQRTLQHVRIRIESGPEKGKDFETDNGVIQGREDMRLGEGETVIVEKDTKEDGSTEYLIREKYRLNAIFWLVIAFFALSVLLGGRSGFQSILGLGASIAILVFYVVPHIANGGNPMQVSLIGAFLIAVISLYLAHGFNRRTSVALFSTLLTLGLSCLIAILFVNVAKLFGMGSEESLYLQIGPLQVINLRGLLLGGIIIGCMGVLDDITTAQTASVDEIRKANPSLPADKLYRAGMSVGREHIASLINTLALAYAGASLPLLLLFTLQSDYPLWVTLNSEVISEEVVRTLVGSATLILAVPISTWLAVQLLPRGGTKQTGGHSHLHAHAGDL